MDRDNEIPKGYLRVTDVLKPFSNFSHIDPDTLVRAADRGSRVHVLCESYANGLFITHVDEDCKCYFDEFRRWFDQTVIKVLHTETRLNSKKYRISGAFDMVAILRGDIMPSLVDFKTPQTEQSSWRLQTAAYKMLCEEAGINVDRRICLQLPKQDCYAKVIEYLDYETDRDLYLKALELYRFFEK